MSCNQLDFELSIAYKYMLHNFRNYIYILSIPMAVKTACRFDYIKRNKPHTNQALVLQYSNTLSIIIN